MENRYCWLVLALLSGGSAVAKAPVPARSGYESARWEANAAAAKWRADAKLYRVGLAFHSHGNQSRFEYFSPDRPGRWSSLTVTIGPDAEGALTTTQYALIGPLPVSVPDGLPDPLEALDKLGFKLVEHLSIDLTRVGESNPTIYGLSRTALEEVTRPGQWVWYVQTGVGGDNKLIYVDAVTAQAGAVCWSAKGSLTPAACPVSKRS